MDDAPSLPGPESATSEDSATSRQHRPSIEIFPQADMRTRPDGFTDSPNARSKSITTAEGSETFGILNRHAAQNIYYQVGVSEDKGTRRTMEDAHSFVVDFGGIRGQGFFAVFDGHAGKHAAEWCGGHFHEVLLEVLQSSQTALIPDTLNKTFHDVDERLSLLSVDSAGVIQSGCTAVTAFLRMEDAEGMQSFIIPGTQSPTLAESRGEESGSGDENVESGSDTQEPVAEGVKEKKTSGFKKALKSFGRRTPRSSSPSATATASMSAQAQPPGRITTGNNGTPPVLIPPSTARRVLYCANAGDARAVLCRAGKAIRLTYDHKGSDKREAKRITDAGGFVMSGRVNGILAVTRSLGDSSMKEFVVGAPYTTETELGDEDEFLVLACDGLWDVTTDQAAVDLVRDLEDAQAASARLLEHAIESHTLDNVTVIVVRFKNSQSHCAATVTAPAVPVPIVAPAIA